MDLLLKIKQLADQGIGGEKANARIKLEKLLEKYGIQECELDSEVQEYFEFKTKGNKKLFFHTAWSVLDGWDGTYIPVRGGGVKIKMTISKKVELEYKWDMIIANFRAEQRRFFRAFVNTNKLYSKGATSNRTWEDLTDREKIELMKMWKIAANLEPVVFHKQLK